MNEKANVHVVRKTLIDAINGEVEIDKVDLSLMSTQLLTAFNLPNITPAIRKEYLKLYLLHIDLYILEILYIEALKLHSTQLPKIQEALDELFALIGQGEREIENTLFQQYTERLP